MPNPALKILHVEDDYFDATLIEEMLNETSPGQILNLNRVGSIKEAISDLDKNKYNVILLDLILKDMSGIRNVEILHEQFPETPIVVITGIEGFDSATKAIRAGAQEYIVKAYENADILRSAIRNAIERKECEKNLYRKVNYDSISGLPNHSFFVEYLEREISKAKRWQKQIGIMLIDTYKFKEINKNMDPEKSICAFQEIAKKIKSALRSSDFLSRYGNDEFALMLDMRDSCVKIGGAQVAGKITDLMKIPLEIDEEKIQTPINIGLALYPNNGESSGEILKAADKALYRAKQSGSNIYKFA